MIISSLCCRMLVRRVWKLESNSRCVLSGAFALWRLTSASISRRVAASSSLSESCLLFRFDAPPCCEGGSEAWAPPAPAWGGCFGAGFFSFFLPFKISSSLSESLTSLSSSAGAGGLILFRRFMAAFMAGSCTISLWCGRTPKDQLPSPLPQPRPAAAGPAPPFPAESRLRTDSPGGQPPPSSPYSGSHTLSPVVWDGLETRSVHGRP
mmetsp:Transcript_15066/g.37692  ORF Transcript_15066/g.37692 Transcript_15066/m.37692 type:complete len:208 (-) Transcript_15066:140-763(-)